MFSVRSLTCSLVLALSAGSALVAAGGAASATTAADDGSRVAPVVATTDVAAAGPGERRNKWGAIALSADNYAVTITYRPTKARAKKTVVRECRRISARPSTCRWVAAFANQCGALAVTSDPQTGLVTGAEVGFGRTQARAKRKAVRKLPGGYYRAGACTPR